MLDDETLSETLETLSDRRVAATRGREIRPLKGLRGVPDGEVARVAAAAWNASDLHLDDDRAALDRLFSASYEDGLVAIGLVAAALPDDPEAALDIGSGWLERVDDVFTADALGWLILGPASLAAGRPLDDLIKAAQGHGHEAARRAVMMAGLCMTPEPLSGPAAAPLRGRLGERHVRFVEAPLSNGLELLADAFLRDESPAVRKALRRVLRAWAKADPAAAVAWAGTVRGGLPRLLGDEIKKARRRVGSEP